MFNTRNLIPGWNRQIVADRIGCLGTTIRTSSGIYFDFMNPIPEMINIEDIATSLSKICRFGGHTYDHYSVAEHCVVGTEYANYIKCSMEECRAFLLHDASEAYIGDIVKPLKVVLGEKYTKIEDKIQDAIGERFDVDFKATHKVVKDIDNKMLFAERRKFQSDDHKWTGEDSVEKIDSHILLTGWSHFRAKDAYLEMCKTFGVQ